MKGGREEGREKERDGGKGRENERERVDKDRMIATILTSSAGLASRREEEGREGGREEGREGRRVGDRERQ